jgi:single-strand DNA-binding protein
MNKFIISGNITKEIDLKYSQSGKAYAKFTVAVTRRFDRDKSDFFNVTAFGKVAENVANFLDKGSKVLVEGEVQIDSKDGKYYTNVLAENVEFLDSKKKQDKPAQTAGDPFAGKGQINITIRTYPSNEVVPGNRRTIRNHFQCRY